MVRLRWKEEFWLKLTYGIAESEQKRRQKDIFELALKNLPVYAFLLFLFLMLQTLQSSQYNLNVIFHIFCDQLLMFVI